MTKIRKRPRRNGSLHHYEIFGRSNPKDSLRHLGYIVAPNEEFARSHAMMTYDEYRWIEFVMVRRDAMIPIVDDAARRVGVV